MSNGTSDGERRDDSFVERLGDRISQAPPVAGQGPARPRLGGIASPKDFGDDSTSLSHESEPPPPMATGTLPPPAEESGLYDAPPIVQPPPSRPDDAFAEFEASEMPGESTRIEESEIIADQSTAILDEGPKMPFLFVESGKDKGKEYVLQEGETGVGRGIDNDVILTDVSVSRKHLRVMRDGATLVLRDLGSGNGTTVNGQRVHQIPLNEGDRIELGETVLVVRYPGEGGGSAAPAGSTHETAVPDVGVGPPPTIPAWGSPQPPPISASAESVAPRDGHTATVRLPRRTLALAVAGIAAVALMIGVGVGAILLVAGRSDTPVAIATVPITSVPVLAAPPATAAVPTTVAVVPTTVAVVPTTVAAVPTTVAASSTAPATTVAMAPPATGTPVLAPAPSAVAPPPPSTLVAAPSPDPAPAQDPHHAPPSRGAHTPRARAGREATTSVMASALARATTAYNGGDFDGAAAIARDAARHTTGTEQHTLEAMANNIDSFAGLYPRIRSAGDALGPVASTVPIALRLDRQIVAGGHYAREIQPRYVRYLVSQARTQISSAPQTACPRVRDALDLDAGNADAQGLARQCETAAARMLSDAQSREHTDAAGAQRSYQAIQQMVPRTSATYRTAGERLAGMRRTTARRVDEDE